LGEKRRREPLAEGPVATVDQGKEEEGREGKRFLLWVIYPKGRRR